MSGARRFSKVSPAVWGSQRFMGLPSSDEKLLYLYFLTSEHMTSAGAYRIKEGYAIADLGWTAPQYRKARVALVEAELIAYDEGHETVYVLRWFTHNPPQNEKHAKGTQRLIGELDSEIIQAKVMEDFEAVEELRAPSSLNLGASPTLRAQLTSVNGRR
jgi:hypothetical protein